jgi:hypothetical protein
VTLLWYRHGNQLQGKLIMRALGLALIAAALAACASSGTRVDNATVATFERGPTTSTQVRAALSADRMARACYRTAAA